MIKDEELNLNSSSNEETSFFLSNKRSQIHKINQLNQQKDYTIQLETTPFHYCKEQLIFLSRKALHHFDSSISPFQIKIDDLKNPKRVIINELKSSFLMLDSLFHLKEEIETNETNVDFFSLLANILGNPYLLSQCEKVFSEHHRSFSFNFKQLQFISQEERESVNNFHIQINDSVFEANRILFSVLSDRFNEINSRLIQYWKSLIH
jgi:hypothetical protein